MKARLSRRLTCRKVEHEVESELLFHLELRTEQNLRQGMTLAEAEREAAKCFGDFERIKNQCVEIGRRNRPLMRALKSLLIIMFLTGVLTRASSADIYSRQIGQMLMIVAVLSGLLLYLRGRRFDSSLHQAVDSSPLGLNHHGPVPSAASNRTGLTPLERAIRED